LIGTKLGFNLEYGRTVFHPDFFWRGRMIMLGWVTETQFRNIHRYTLIVLKLGLPLLKFLRANVIDD
jgi:hypothetical protein